LAFSKYKFLPLYEVVNWSGDLVPNPNETKLKLINHLVVVVLLLPLLPLKRISYLG